ncbi:MAG: DinB family protein [Dehalococcoidia bacterium]
MPVYPPLAITRYWERLNDGLIALAGMVPDDKWNWSPAPGEWNFRGVFLHIAGSRHHWMENAIRDGQGTPDFIRNGQSPDGLKEQLALSWSRQMGLLGDATALASTYRSADDADPWDGDGNWIAFRRLEHDILHRAQLLSYFQILGIELPGVDSAWGAR